MPKARKFPFFFFFPFSFSPSILLFLSLFSLILFLPPSFPAVEQHQELLQNERANFKVLSRAVREIGGIPLLALSQDMSNTVPDEKVVMAYVTYLCNRLLEVSEEARAAVVLQLAWRNRKLKRQAAEEMAERRRAMAEQKRAEQQRQLQAAIVLQAAWRRVQACRLVAYLRQERAAVLLQSVARGFLARTRLAALQAERTCAATALQAGWRGRQARHLKAERLHAVRVLQAAARAYVARQQRAQAAAILIQRVWRGHVARQSYERQYRAVVTIQQLARALLARQTVARLRAEHQRELAAGTIYNWLHTIRVNRLFASAQQFVRQAIDGRRERRQAAALTLQAHLRGLQARTAYARLQRAVRLMQPLFRFRLHQRTQHRAALVIQHTLRGVVAQRSYQRQRAAAIKVQAQWRAFCAQARFARQRAGVVRLQALVRQRQARDEYLRTRRAAIVVQRAWRALRASLAEHQAATLLQACVRRWLAVKQLQQLRARAAYVQQWARVAKAHLSAVVVQRALRSHMQRQHALARLAYVQQWAKVIHANLSAVVVQRAFRSHVERQRELARLAYVQQWAKVIHANLSAISIQRAMRQHVERQRELARLAHVQQWAKAVKGNLSAIRIQRTFRLHISHQRELARLAYVQQWAKVIHANLSAIGIQRAFRQHVERQRELARLAYVQQWAKAVKANLDAISIQRAFRSYMAVRTQAASTLQRHFRRWRQAQNQGMSPLAAALRIQAWYRGCMTRRVMCGKLKSIHLKLVDINSKVEDHMKLGNRTKSALEILLTHKQLTYVLRACENLSTATRLSTECCEKIVTQQQAVPILFQLIRSCNRSKPHMAVLLHTLHIFHNLVNHPKTMDAILSEPDTVPLFVEQLQMFRDKSDICEAATGILLTLAKNPDVIPMMRAQQACMTRLKGILQLLKRKAALESKGVKRLSTYQVKQPAASDKTPLQV